MSSASGTTSQSDTPRPDDLGRVAPHSIDAEVQVLGSLMLDERAFDVVCQIAKQDFFFRPAHQIIYGVIERLSQAGNPIDVVAIKNALQESGRLDAIGGLEYLAQVIESVPNAANAEYYAKMVRDKAMLRQLITAGSQIVKDAYDSRQDAQEVIDRAEQSIYEIAEKQIGDQAVAISGLLQQTFEMLQETEGRLITGIASGYQQLDELTSGFQNGEMIILAARPSMGKTSCLLNVAEHMAVVDRQPVAVFSLEMSKEQLAQRVLASHARFNLRDMRRGMISPEAWNSLQTAAGNLQQAPLYIDDTPTLTVLQLRAKARRLASAYNIKCIFVDYLQLMTYSGRADSRQEQITEMSRGIKALARELSVPVIAAAQLNRGPEDRPQHRPRMSDLRESGSIEQDADVVLLLHNEDYYHIGEQDYVPTNIHEIIIAKQRNGPTGTAHLTFLKDFTRFESAAPPTFEPKY